VDNSFARFIDTLNKLNAQNKTQLGGTQYTSEVALGPMASASNQALMRVKKIRPQPTMNLAKLIKKG